MNEPITSDRLRRLGTGVLLLVGSSMLGCRSEAPPSPHPATSSTATGSAAQPVPPPSTLAEAAHPPPKASAQVCRALAVRGKVAAGGAGSEVASGDLLDGSPWLELAKGARLTVKHARTAREVTFDGPGWVRPCYSKEEHFLVSEGTVTTVAGAGARPGAEVLLSTPIGSVRYADADLRLAVSKTKLTVEVKSGKAWLEGAETGAAPEEVEKGKQAVRTSGDVDVKALVRACEHASEASDTQARAVLDRTSPRAGLGERAAAHLLARQAARSACGRAAAGVARLQDASEREAVTATVEQADARWRGLSQARKGPNQ